MGKVTWWDRWVLQHKETCLVLLLPLLMFLIFAVCLVLRLTGYL